jgi:branched-chain amino acid transport system substrate-binding protein
MRGCERRSASAGFAAAAALGMALGAGLTASPAAAKDIKVCLIAGKTGPLEAYAKQTEAGFMHHEGRQ